MRRLFGFSVGRIFWPSVEKSMAFWEKVFSLSLDGRSIRRPFGPSVGLLLAHHLGGPLGILWEYFWPFMKRPSGDHENIFLWDPLTVYQKAFQVFFCERDFWAYYQKTLSPSVRRLFVCSVKRSSVFLWENLSGIHKRSLWSPWRRVFGHSMRRLFVFSVGRIFRPSVEKSTTFCEKALSLSLDERSIRRPFGSSVGLLLADHLGGPPGILWENFWPFYEKTLWRPW